MRTYINEGIEIYDKRPGRGEKRWTSREWKSNEEETRKIKEFNLPNGGKRKKGKKGRIVKRRGRARGGKKGKRRERKGKGERKKDKGGNLKN